MVHGVSLVVDGFQELSFMVTPFTALEVTRLFIQKVFMGVPGPKSPLVVLLIWHTGMGDCMVLVIVVKSGGQIRMVHGIISLVDGFHELSFIVTPYMVLDLARLFGQQVFMGVPGPKSPLVPLLNWLTGLEIATDSQAQFCVLRIHEIDHDLIRKLP